MHLGRRLAAASVIALLALLCGQQASRARPAADRLRIAFTDVRPNLDIVVAKVDGGHSRVLVGGLGSQAHPDLSRDQRAIVFSNQGEIETITIDGRTRARLTHTERWERTPTWSPDGEKVAWISGRACDLTTQDDCDALEVMNLRERRKTILATGNLLGRPAWSHDSRRIAFTTIGGLFVAMVDGKEVKRVRPPDVSNPSWSPDRDELVVEANRASAATPALLVVIDVVSGRERTLTEGRKPRWASSGEILFAAGPYVAPMLFSIQQDGSRRTQLMPSPISLDWSGTREAVVYSRDGNGGRLEVYDVGLSAIGLRQVTRGGARGLAYSPDGRTLAFVRGQARASLLLVDLRRGSVRRIARVAPWSRPAWSPDGRLLVVSTIRSLVVVSAAHGRVRGISGTGPADHSPTWSPSGKYIAFARRETGEETLFRVRLGGGRPVAIRRHATQPDWAPRRARLVFLDLTPRPPGGYPAYDIATVRADGSGIKHVTRSRDYEERFPRWSPDGRWIMFVRAGIIAGETVAIVRPDGGRARNVVALHSEGRSDVAWRRIR